MGKPSKADYLGDQPGETGDVVSLHTTPGSPGASRLPNYRDEHEDEDAPALAADGLDDLPPLYSDAVEGSASASGALLLPPPAVAPSTSQLRYRPFQTDAGTGVVAYMERALETSPRELAHHLGELAKTPPRPQLRIVGTHSETRRKSDGKSSETTTVTDFALTIEMAPYLYADAQHRRSWAQLRSVDNDEKAHRGTLFARRGDQQQHHVEAGRLVDDKPSLDEWCHRFCASHAGLKCFTLRRRMTGFDMPRVREQLSALVRRTNYRGRVDIDLVTRDARVDVYNEARINRWRLTQWIRLLFFCTLLFVFAWPYLWLRTRRWEVAVVDWPFSRPADDEGDYGDNDDDDGTIRHHRRRPRHYVALSEDQWYNLWARAIHRAVLDRRQKTLDQDDLRAAAAAEPSFEAAGASADGAAGLFRAGLNAMNEMNIQMGWGADR